MTSFQNKFSFLPLMLILLCSALIAVSCSTVDLITYSNTNGSKKIFSDQISLITYNIKAIYEKEKNEIDSLMGYINAGNFDFAIFQELFNESTRDYIIAKTNTSHFNNIIARVDYNSFPEFIFQDAGLFLLSSHPRVDLSGIDFGDDIKNSNGIIHMILDKEISRSNDFLANKSVLGALFEIEKNTNLFLFATHVQALGTDEHKEFQMQQIKNFIEQSVKGVLDSGLVKSSKDLSVILAGDFNSDAYNPERFEVLQRSLGYPRDLHKEFHGDKKEYTFKFSSRSPSRRFDYILAYDSLMNWNFRKINVLSINAIDITDSTGASISDHLGLQAALKIN